MAASAGPFGRQVLGESNAALTSRKTAEKPIPVGEPFALRSDLVLMCHLSQAGSNELAFLRYALATSRLGMAI
jgi:hypothetical protein